ncbi:MAG: glycerol kinase GlpK [Clostridia bacterium]
MKKYIIAFDQGTTSSRAVAFDREGTLVAIKNKEFPQIFPRPGWVEHNPEDLVSSQLSAFRDLLKENDILPQEIDSIGITNQRETIVVWDRTTGLPVYNAIVWQCRRTAAICEDLKARGYAETIRSRTGLLPDAYFSATKIQWILDNVEGARERAEKGQLMAGTVDSWLIFNMSGGSIHVTDITNASRTMLFNIIHQEWDPELLRMMNIPAGILPEVRGCSEPLGHYDCDGVRIPVCGCAGDQQAALFGQLCLDSGDTKNTYGTGCFLLMNTGKEPVFSGSGLLTTVAWRIGGDIRYALEGSVFNAGSSIQWLRDELGIIADAAESEGFARQVEDTGDVYFVPAFTGLGTPHWDMYARGILIGITRGTNKCHIIRATLESIAFQSDDVLTCMKKDSGLEMGTLKVDGGASRNGFLMQFQADLLGVRVFRPKITETTALGAAFLSGLHTGFYESTDTLKKICRADMIYYPGRDESFREKARKRWSMAVEKAKGWAMVDKK